MIRINLHYILGVHLLIHHRHLIAHLLGHRLNMPMRWWVLANNHSWGWPKPLGDSYFSHLIPYRVFHKQTKVCNITIWDSRLFTLWRYFILNLAEISLDIDKRFLFVGADLSETHLVDMIIKNKQREIWITKWLKIDIVVAILSLWNDQIINFLLGWFHLLDIVIYWNRAISPVSLISHQL